MRDRQLISPSAVMSAAAVNSGGGGVRNLRAMFENKASGDQSTSPPSRGRSPNLSEVSSSSRPVSKVRASFVAVERPGEPGQAPLLGLRKASEVSSIAEAGENEDNTAKSADDGPIPKTKAKDDETERASPPPNAAAPALSAPTEPAEGGLGRILKGSDFDEPTVAPPQSPPKTTEAAKVGEALASGQAQNKIPKTRTTNGDASKAAAMVKAMQPSAGQKPPPPPTKLQTTKNAHPVKAPPTRQVHSQPSPRSPTLPKQSPKTPTFPSVSVKGGPAKIKGVMESARVAREAREHALKEHALKEQAPKEGKSPSIRQKESVTPPRSKTGTNGVRQRSAPISPKPVRPKSPTRPGKLPVGATASTAASVARAEAHHTIHEFDLQKPVSRRLSTSSTKQPKATTTLTASSLAKRASHASLTNGHERPKSRVSSVSKPDEGFLARMMRPTASSAQKVHERVLVNSPPRPRAAAPAKSKDTSRKHAPPKMNPPISGGEGPRDSENNENDIEPEHHDVVVPEMGHPSPPHVVNEDPITSIAEEGAMPSRQAEGLTTTGFEAGA